MLEGYLLMFKIKGYCAVQSFVIKYGVKLFVL